MYRLWPKNSRVCTTFYMTKNPKNLQISKKYFFNLKYVKYMLSVSKKTLVRYLQFKYQQLKPFIFQLLQKSLKTC